MMTFFVTLCAFMMNLTSVIRKTELGKQEILNPSNSSLPRELRVILILIDGKKTVQDYYESLSSKRFLSQYPSIEECFMVLESMELIEAVDDQTITKSSLPTPSTAPAIQKQEPWNNPTAKAATAAVIDTANDTAPNIPSASIRVSILKDAIPIVAEFIESNIPTDCWSLMIQLEMVNTFEDLTTFLKSISQKYKGDYDSGEFNKLIQRLNDLKNT